MSKLRCADIAHDFEKFDDATIFCRKCGEQRVMDVQALIAKLPQPIYMPCPWPHYPSPSPWRWYPNTYPTVTYNTMTTGAISDTVTIPSTVDNVTYTAEVPTS